MTFTLAELNALPQAQATDALRSCCGAARWVSEIVARRPYASRDTLFETADRVWSSMRAADWREAFAHHPRIGERARATARDDRAAAWSAGEQSGVALAAASVQEQLAAVNRDYEQRFGHIYIVSAAGKSADTLLTLARERLSNDADTELRVAAGEQGKIMRLRLEQLVSSGP